jgi:hypothetical protein
MAEKITINLCHIVLLRCFVFQNADYTEHPQTSHTAIKHTSDIRQCRLQIDPSGTGTINEVFVSFSARSPIDRIASCQFRL